VIDLTTFRERRWCRILQTADVRRRTIYQARHSFCARALDRGVSPRDVAQALGHADLQMVVTTYSRWLPGSGGKATVDAMDAVLETKDGMAREAG
jgi:integrase